MTFPASLAPSMRRTLLLFGVLLAAACGDKAPVAVVVDPLLGIYPLRSINGNPPPQIIAQDTSGVLSILSGTVSLNANQQFVDSTDIQLVTSTGVLTDSDVGRGTWRVAADSVFFRAGGSTSEYAMGLSGTTLTQDFFGIILVYRK